MDRFLSLCHAAEARELALLRRLTSPNSACCGFSPRGLNRYRARGRGEEEGERWTFGGERRGIIWPSSWCVICTRRGGGNPKGHQTETNKKTTTKNTSFERETTFLLHLPFTSSAGKGKAAEITAVGCRCCCTRGGVQTGPPPLTIVNLLLLHSLGGGKDTSLRDFLTLQKDRSPATGVEMGEYDPQQRQVSVLLSGETCRFNPVSAAQPVRIH